MKHRVEHKIDYHTMEAYGDQISDDKVFRDMICQMVKEIPLEELKKVFHLSKLDPRQLDDGSDCEDYDLKEYFDLKELRILREERVVKYKVKLNLK